MSALNITPIGTCRIRTPLQRSQGRYPVRMHIEGTYGLVHTSHEALQLVRYMQGEKTLDPRSYPSLLNPDVDPASIGVVKHEPADLYIVEISSAKKITALGDAQQINYLYRSIPEFFSQKSLTSRFWSLAQLADREPLLDFLETVPAFREMSEDNKALLRDMRMHIQTNDEIAAEMAEIVRRLGPERVLFKTHVNAITGDSRIIPERDRVIAAVKAAARDLGVDCFDPSEAMFSVGQEVALDRGGTDLSHYTLAFSDLVFLRLFRQFIGPRFGLSDAVDEAAISAQIDEEIIAGRIGSLITKDPALAAAELDSALRKMPDAASLSEMKGRLLFATGRHEEARPILTALAKRDALSGEGRSALLDLAVATQDWDEARDLYERLLADEVDLHRAFVLGAETYLALGENVQAADSLKRAYLSDPKDLETGLRALDLFVKADQSFPAAAMRRQIIENNADTPDNIAILRDWALAHRDAQILSSVHALLAPDDFDQTARITRQLVDFGDHDASAMALEQLNAMAGDDADRRAVVADIAAQVSRWAEEAAKAARPGPAYVLAKAVATCRGAPLPPEIAALVEDFRVKLVENAQGQRFDKIVDDGADALALVMDDEELSWRYAFAVHKIGHNEDALALLEKAMARHPGSMQALRLHGRIAAIAGRYDLAIPSFTALRDSGSQVAVDHGWEIDRFFDNLEKRGVKALRETIKAGDIPLALTMYRTISPALSDQRAIEPMRLRLVRALVLEARRLDSANGMEAELEAVLRETLDIDPANVRAMRRLARLLMDTERFGESRALWLEAMERDPSNVSDMRNVRQCTAMMNENEGEPVSV